MLPSYTELQTYLEENNFPSGRQLLAKQHKNFVQKLQQVTSFLDELNPPLQLRCYVVYNNITSIPICQHPECNNQVGFSKSIPSVHGTTKFSYYFNKHCCYKCSHSNSETIEKRKQTSLKNYGATSYMGSEEGKENYRKTHLERYGVEHSSQIPESQIKKKQTFIKRFGVDNNMKSEQSKTKFRENSQANHGVSWPNQTEEAKEKAKQTNRERRGVDYSCQSPEVKDKIYSTFVERYNGHPMYCPEIKSRVIATNLSRYNRNNPTQKHIDQSSMEILNNREKLQDLYSYFGEMGEVAELLNVSVSNVQRKITEHDIDTIPSKTSRKENEVDEFVQSLGFNTIRSSRKPLHPLEADITVTEKNFIIEFNGIYWHSDAIKNKNYHQNKSLTAIERGYSLLHIWEDDWEDPNKREIIKSKIKSKLGCNTERIYARNCYISFPSISEVRFFYDTNHIQGFVRATYHIGLRDKSTDELVACCSFHHCGDSVYDLNRFATSKTVVGGCSKILSYFKKHMDWKRIFTFASLDYSDGNLYEQIGFKRLHITPPNMWYVKGPVRERREQYMKHKLDKKLESFDPSLTEKENMMNHGFQRLFDAGSIKYQMIHY